MQAFLFTDIESSTRLWEEQPDEMAAALERHDQIMRAAIDEAGGRLLKTTGDGAIGVFDTASDAIHSAIHAQLALESEPWEAAPVRARMGIHAGATLSRDDDHFGPVMNRTARLMAAGHGGQILVSHLAMELASDAGGVSFKDLGTHRLKDLTEPEHLHQVLHAELTAGFPDLKTLDSRANNLPLQATAFLGRSQELGALRDTLDAATTRLLTIIGPGGAGKTRLSLQLAADMVDEFRDGVWFVDLAADETPEDAFETVIRSLALPVSRTGSPLDVLRNRLRDKQMLLVLDNFEQVVEAGPGVAELLQTAPELTVVVTTREALRVSGEQLYSVPPLSLPDLAQPPAEIQASEAVQLFIDRAGMINPGFALGEDNARDVAAICIHLDGLPLAIELAAARLNVFSPSDLLIRITDRLDVLASGARDLPERQRTLWGAIGWSYELLNEDERAVFEMLSVFNGAELPAIESVAAGALDVGTVLDTVASLVDKSLVRRVEGGALRFVMLQMIKEYGAEQLAADSERQSRTRAAHARHYATFAHQQHEAAETGDREAALTHLEAEIDNLRESWDFWLAPAEHDELSRMMDGMWTLHTARGWYHGAIALAADMLSVLSGLEASPDRDAAEFSLRTRQARALMAVHGYNLEVEQAFQRALELAEKVGSSEDQLPVLRALASYYLQTGSFEQALGIGEQLMKTGSEVGNQSAVIEAHNVIAGTVLYFDSETSLEHFDFVISNYNPAASEARRFRLGPDTGVVARMSTAIVLWEVGHLDQAVQRADEAMAFAAEINHPYSQAWALFHAGFFAVNRGRFEDVLECSHQLAAISDEHEYALWRTLATVLEGVARTAMGDIEGVALTEQGVELYQGLAPPPVFWPLMLGLRSAVHAMSGDMSKALELIDEAVAIMEAGGIVPPDLLIRRGDLLHAIRGPEDPEAQGLYQQAIEVSQALSLNLPELRARTRLVQLHRSLGNGADETKALSKLVDQFDEGHEEHDLQVSKDLLRTR